MKKHATVFYALLALGLSVLLHCSLEIEDSENHLREQATKTFGQLSELEIDNITGSIEISNWDSDSVRVTCIKKARTQQRLEEIEVIFDRQENALSVETKLPGKCRRCEVEYLVSVPKGFEKIIARTVTGSVILRDATTVNSFKGVSVTGSIKGALSCRDLELDVTTGGISLELVDVAEGGSIDLHVVTGRVELTMPADFQADVGLKTVTGSIRTDFPVKTYGTAGRNSLQGTIGDGGVKCSIQTVTGSIVLIQKR
ncbi:MAG: hypothetical protein ACOY90_21965 [Candidatus Zhuqueibacterota bacterium]